MVAVGHPEDSILLPWYSAQSPGKTISPLIPFSSFHALTFLDTITSYINEGRTLGWIANDQTKDKYMRLIDSARSNLATNNRGITKARLVDILTDVQPDSAAGLITSEAYALLRFNTEYVLKKLREEDSTFAAENRSSSWNATATNNARHLAKSGNYLHEVFTSGGEVFYRRSTDGGSSWSLTHRLNIEAGENSHPCMTVTERGSLHVVWQRQTNPGKYEIMHSYSRDAGASWSTPTILPEASEAQVSDSQTEGPTPVIAEQEGAYLIVVYCGVGGLQYRTSESDGDEWQMPNQDLYLQYPELVRFPSVAGSSNYVSLVYDYAGMQGGPYSQTFDGSRWSGEVSMSEDIGAGAGAFASVALDDNKNPIAAWSSNHAWSRSIVFRAGYSDNSWSNWYAEFWGGQISADWLYPSITYYNRQGSGQYGVAIVHPTAGNSIKLIRYDDPPWNPPSWVISTLSQSGTWAAVTEDDYYSGHPIYSWTDQNAFPYQVMVGTLSEQSPMKPHNGAVRGEPNQATVTQKRRGVVYHRTLKASLSLEVDPLKVVLADGDTTLVPFKPSSLRHKGTITLSTMWEYVGTDTVRLPSTARRLVIGKNFTERGPKIAQRKFYLRLLNAVGTQLAVLDSSSASGTVSVDIRPYAGSTVIVRPQVVLPGITPSAVKVGVGDIVIVPEVGTRK